MPLETMNESLIHRLPTEILRQIFIAHGTTNDITTLRGTRVPAFKIASICSYWRSLAFVTTNLWNTISLVVITAGPNVRWHSKNYPLVQRLVDLSGNSPLYINIKISGVEIPPIVCLLCDQSHRWQTLSLFCSTLSHFQFINSLSLDSLQIFRFTLNFMLFDSYHIKAPKLHTVSLSLLPTWHKPILPSLPWKQITDLTIKAGYAFQIHKALSQMPNISKLNIRVYPDSLDNSYYQTSITSNLTSLTVLFSHAIEEKGLQHFFDSLLLPRLAFLALVSEPYAGNKDGELWSRTHLPSLLTRSSAVLTSFTLGNTLIDTTDLIHLLHLMPKLTTLALSEPPEGKLMINRVFLLSLVPKSDSDSNSQELVPSLESLSLKISHRSTLSSDSFNMTTFRDLIISRSNLKSVELKTSHDSLSLDSDILRSLIDIRMKGVALRIKDKDGDVLFRR